MSKIIKMKHEVTGKVADVHPDEVENYAAGGYVKANADKPAKRPKSAKVAGRE